MKKRTLPTWFAIALLLFSLAPIQASRAQKDTGNGIFWEISGKGLTRPSYLFGTYHLLSGAYLNKLPNVKAAFEGADGVVVESEIDSSKLMQMLPMLVMQDKKLSDLVSKEDYDMLASEVQQSTGTPIELMAQLKPIFITLMLTVTYAKAGRLSELEESDGSSLDSHIAKVARQKKQGVSAFESMEEQMHLLFDHHPVEEQARQLVEFVKLKDEMVTAQDELLGLYLREDLDGLYTLYQKYEKQFGESSWLLDDRNENWIKQLPAILEEGSQFIAVGALHLAGNKGLVELLRKQGYTVTAREVK